MKFTLHALALAVTLALAGPVTSAQNLPLALRDAARKAVETNPEVQAKWHAFLQADAERDAVSGSYRPQIDIVAGAGVERRETPTANLGTYGIGSAAVTLTQMLFDGAFTQSEVARASHAKLVRYYELMDATETITLEVSRAYADVLRYRELVDLAKNNYALHRQTSEQINERVAGGVGRKVDAEQASGRLALAESNLLTELSNLHDVNARYLRLVGEAPPAKLGDLPEELKLQGMPANIKAALETAYLNNPAMNAAVENVDAQRAQVQARKSAFAPRVDFRLRQGLERNQSGVIGNYSDTSAQIVLNYNLSRGGADQARELQAARAVNQALDLQEKACRDIRQTVTIAFNDVKKLAEQMGYLDQHRLSTEKSREAYRQQFDIGQRTLLDLLDTQNEFFEASRAYANARYDRVIAESRTLAGVGGLTNALNVARANLPSAQDLGQTRQRDLTGICTVPNDLNMVIDKEKLMADAPPVARFQPPAPVVAPTPKAAAVPAKVSFKSDAFFDYNKATLKPEGQAKLAEFATNIKAAGQDKDPLTAVGHTDSRGSDDYNLRLSLARARSVKTYLVSQGLDAQLISTEGRGETEPVADNATDEGRARNRRVDITIGK
ncbi:MAG: hypothetical protein RLZZ591_2610 [Pseudomonadota bacterium]|jgi:adhesin transport system outer membrane protein